MSEKSWDPIWEEIFKQQEWGKYPYVEIVRFVARNFYKFENRKEIKILEVGSGPGAHIWYLAREGFDTYGIDASPSAIEQCEKRLTSEGLSANLEVGDILNLPYEDDFFDCVIDFECFCCNNEENTKKILKEVKRVMKKGALMCSRTFTERQYIGKEYDKISELEFDNAKDGPFENRGFIRLTSREKINELYGEHFNVKLVDTIDISDAGGKVNISEYQIVCEK